MKTTTLCVIGAVLAMTAAAPVAAQNRVSTDNGIWAPWAADQGTPVSASAPSPAPEPPLVRAPVVRAPAAVTRVVAEAPVAETTTRRLIRMERFWVVGSFR